jgi:nicotinamidase-related amidase
MTILALEAQPYEYRFDPKTTALIIIDMQRDFLEPGGFAESLGDDVSKLRRAIEPLKKVLKAARDSKMLIIHTREGHRPDLSDAPPAKLARGHAKFKIGDIGPMGRILIRGEPGHDIISELYPHEGEPIIDKPGKGSFYQTDLSLILQNKSIKTLIICGVTTEVCVHTTMRDGNDRGYECCILEDCVASYFPDFHKASIELTKAQGGIFGWVSDSSKLIKALEQVEVA